MFLLVKLPVDKNYDIVLVDGCSWYLAISKPLTQEEAQEIVDYFDIHCYEDRDAENFEPKEFIPDIDLTAKNANKYKEVWDLRISKPLTDFINGDAFVEDFYQ